MIVGIYAASLAFLLLILSIRVIGLRGNPVFKWFAFAPNGREGLQRAIRGHGNLTEYAPLFLILLLIAELNGMEAASLHAYGLSFLLGRVMHGVCFGFLTRSLPLRIGGTALTLFPLLGLAVILGLDALSR